MSKRRDDETRSSFLRNPVWMFGAAVMVLGGLLFVGSVLPTAPDADASSWGGSWGHGGHGDPGEHAELAVEWVLRWVDATPEQIEQVNAIAKDSIAEISNLKGEHEKRHEAFIAEMSKETIDREAIERLRHDGMNVADQLSVRLANALVDAAEVLTVEQRLELVELAERFHRR